MTEEEHLAKTQKKLDQKHAVIQLQWLFAEITTNITVRRAGDRRCQVFVIEKERIREITEWVSLAIGAQYNKERGYLLIRKTNGVIESDIANALMSSTGIKNLTYSRV